MTSPVAHDLREVPHETSSTWHCALYGGLQSASGDCRKLCSRSSADREPGKEQIEEMSNDQEAAVIVQKRDLQTGRAVPAVGPLADV